MAASGHGDKEGSSVAPPGGREHNERGPRDLCGNLCGSREGVNENADTEQDI